MDDKEKIKEMCENIGYMVAKCCNEEETELFEIFLDDWIQRIEIIDKAIDYIEKDDKTFNTSELLKILKGEE